LEELTGNIGPKFVAAIETGRQKNGDFDCFLVLQRAKGNEPKKLGTC
jgi:hypothetical protein